ncbi:hypothetical protein [Rhodoplanes sp. SY1]|uniref:hypothetical protein n=1 Tax=Rhodoplanes sp. SY1 TaxID=3166646 RepID=UPI0038B67791
MELSFDGMSSAKAGYLAQELELALLKAGLPSTAVSVQRISAENMDIGTVVTIAVDAVSTVLDGSAAVATVILCIREFANRHGASVKVRNGEETVLISPETVDGARSARSEVGSATN